MKDPIRCAVCGKLIASGDPVMQMSTGKLQDAKVVAMKDWGMAHKSCFNRAMPSQQAALEEIRRLAKAG